MRLFRRKKTPVIRSPRQGRVAWVVFWAAASLAIVGPAVLVVRGQLVGGEEPSQAGLRIVELTLAELAVLRRSADMAVLSETLGAELLDQAGEPAWSPLAPGAMAISPPAFMVWDEREPGARLVLSVREHSPVAAAWRDAEHRRISAWRNGVVLTLSDAGGTEQSFWLLEPRNGGGS